MGWTEDPKALPPQAKTLPELVRAAACYVMNGQNSNGKNWGNADYHFLFDQKEMSKSLASLPELAPPLKKLREMLETWMQETRDQGGTPNTHPALADIVAATLRKTYDKP